MDDPNRDPRPRKRFRSSPRLVQYQYPRQDPASDTGSPGLSTNIDQGTSLLLPSDTATGSDGLATNTRTRSRTHSSSQGGTSDAASSTVDSGSSSTEAVSDSGGVTGTASNPTGSSAADVQTSTGAANSMAAHPTTNHQQPTVNAVPSSLSPTSTSAYTSVLITTTATINGHLTTFATLVPTTLSSFPHDSSPPLKPPAVAAAVVGTLFATALLAGLGYLFVRRRKQRKAKTALNAARKHSMRRGRRVLDDDDGDDEDGLPMRYAGSGSAGSHSHSMSTSYQYGVVGSLPPGSPTRGDSIPSSSSFGYNRSQDAFSFQHIGMNEFAGKDPSEVRRLRAGRTGSSSGSIFREDFNSESLGGARLITTNASTPRPSSMASSPNSPSPTGTPTPTSNPFDNGYFPHKRSSTASSSALGLLEAIGGVMPSSSLEVVNMSRSASPASVHEGTQLPYHQPKRSSVTSIRTHSLPSPKSTLPLTATTTTAVATPSRAPSLTSPAGAFQYPPKSRSPPIPLAPVSGSTANPTTTRTRSPQPFPASTSSTSPRPSTSPRSSTYGPYTPGSRNSLGPGSLPPGAASPPGPLARTSIIVDEQFGVSASNAGLPPTDYHYKMPPNRRRSSSGATSISQAMQSSPQPHFNPSDLVPGRERQKRRDSFVLPDVPVSGTGSLRDKDRGSRVDLRPYLSEDEDDGIKSGVSGGGIEKRKPRPSSSS